MIDRQQVRRALHRVGAWAVVGALVTLCIGLFVAAVTAVVGLNFWIIRWAGGLL